jgi:patatin-related protein
MARPGFAPEQEVRFAVVMYGGVSLAIYINGVVQELFRMVRATAPEFELPDQPYGQDAYFHDESLDGTERIYREVGQMLRGDGDVEPMQSPEADIRTRFVVDILSGSSAGGINAIFLAKAIANQQELADLRDLWIHEADMGALVNDRQSYRRIRDLPVQSPPRSLLNSGRLYLRALAALRGMARSEERREDKYSPAYAEELDLAVTTTDLHGVPLPMQLYDQVVYEARHRNVLRFVYAGPRATGEARNDFGEENDELLAYAARCTSAFPFAFEPAVAQDLPHGSDPPPLQAWNAFFPDYKPEEWPTFAFADGGYLDNKPFSYATEALRRRRADLPVTRKLLYIEPDPTGEPLAPGEAPKREPLEEVPDAVDTSIAAMTLPRVETIRDDIEAVVDRNRTVQRIRRLTLELEETLFTGDDPLQELHEVAPDAHDATADRSLRCPQLMYHPYLQLRVEMVVDDLASACIRLAGGNPASDEVEAARILIRRYVRSEWEEEGLRRAFLARFDLRFRLRRIAFVQDRINVLMRDEHRQRDPQLAELKRALNDVLVNLRRAGRTARRRPVDLDGTAAADDRDAERIRTMAGMAKRARLEPDVLSEVLRAPRERDVPKVPAFDEAIRALLGEAADHLADVLREADEELPVTLRDTPTLALYYWRFESFDMITLPLTYPGLEEVNPVDVIRIAPEDATGLISEGDRDEMRRKLAGTSLGHFGGFMDATWRRNDLMWGRLDGAERILDSLLPDSPLRDKLHDRAFAAIIREELVDQDAYALTDLMAGALGANVDADELVLQTLHEEQPPTERRQQLLNALQGLTDEQLLTQFRENFEVPRRLDPRATTSVAGRAATVGGRVLDEASKRRSMPTKPAFWLTRMGRLLWGISEVALPGGRRIRLPVLLFRHWTLVAGLLAVILILVGALGVEAAQRVGWILLIGTIVLRIVVWVASGLMTEPAAVPGARAPPSPLRYARWLGAIAVGAGIALLVAGIWVDDLSAAGLLVATAGVLVTALVWAFAVPSRRAALGALSLVAAVGVGLAALELGRHFDADVDAAAEKLPGSRDSGFEGSVRDGWATLWPWSGDDQAEADREPDDDEETEGGEPDKAGGDRQPVAPASLTRGDLDAIREEIARLRQEGRYRAVLGLLERAAAGVPGAMAAVSNWLRTTAGLPRDIAGLAVGVLARGGIKATLAPTFRVDHPNFSLGGLHVGLSPGKVSLGGLRVNIIRRSAPPVTRRIEHFFADQSFAFGQATLTETARQRLVTLRERLARRPGALRIRVHGYADFVGAPATNMRLSRRRAEAVRDVLTAGAAIPARTVRVFPHGETQVRAELADDPWRAYDRRVEVVVLRVR